MMLFRSVDFEEEIKLGQTIDVTGALLVPLCSDGSHIRHL